MTFRGIVLLGGVVRILRGGVRRANERTFSTQAKLPKLIIVDFSSNRTFYRWEVALRRDAPHPL